MPQVGAAIAGIGAAFKATAIGSFLTTTFAGRLLVSIGASLLLRALAPKPDIRTPGIKTTTTAAGGTNPCSFIIGTYATGGYMVCPAMSHGNAGQTPNAYLTYVIELGDIPGQTLERLIVNDRYVEIGTTPHADYGLPILGELEGYAWVKYHAGDQTAADPMLLAKYGTYPERPWTSDMIGRGLCYAILTFRYNRERFSNLPRVRFEMGGIKLYDPRKDTTVGGSGAHRWDDPATWEPTANPVVQIYNIRRGIALPDGSIWGGRTDPADLPLGNWMAAMNACDTRVDDGDGGTVPQYRAGFEVTVDEEPAEVEAELLKACAGQVADIAGVWKIRVGPPGLPVHFFTDDDVIISREAELSPWPGLDRTYNAIHASYPEPNSLWEEREAPPLYNPVYEGLDGDRQLPADLPLPAVSDVGQVQRLMAAYLAEERRFLRHGLTLPPEAAVIEPLDAAAWTSLANGYTAKVFEVAEVVDDTASCLQQLSLRERAAGDFTPPEVILPAPPTAGGTILPAPQPVESWAVAGETIRDGLAVGRRPALKLSWDGTAAEDADLIAFEVRRTGTTDVIISGLAEAPAGQVLIAQGVVPLTDYEARGRYILDRPTTWSGWLSATTPDVRLGASDFASLRDIFEAQGLSAPEIVDELPELGNFPGRLVFLTTDGLLYRYASGAWTAGVTSAQIAAGTIQAGMLAAGAVLAENISAGSLNADDIQTGRMSTAFLEVLSLLSIDAASAGLAVGKASGTDFATPGLYAGTDGAGGFALLAGRVGTNDAAQALEIGASRGLRLLNARHAVTASLAPPGIDLTTSQTYEMPEGTTAITLQLMGAGGAGESVSSGGALTPGGPGGMTRVELWDGETYTGMFWESPGGLGGETGVTPSGKDGQSSVWGAGGVGAWEKTTWIAGSEGGSYTYTKYPAAAGNGFGAGGGAGRRSWTGTPVGHGGRAAPLIEIQNHDVSALTAPKLVVTIGAAGQKAGQTTNPYQGANGSTGRVRLFAEFTSEIPADVVPLQPTAQGTFVKPGSSGTLQSFPDLGAGLWFLWTTNDTGIGMQEINITPEQPIRIWNTQYASFVSSMTPTYLTSSTSRTIAYVFYSMGSWGGA